MVKASGGDTHQFNQMPAVDGGSAKVVADAVNDAGGLSIGYLATGGLGKFGPGGTMPGSGGSADAELRAVTIGDGHDITIAKSDGSARGGRGGPGGSAPLGGRGGDATVRLEATAQGDSAVDVTATAIGGTGGERGAQRGGTGGTGGATATASNAGARSVRVTADATGGSGSDAFEMDAGSGGTAHARAHGSSSGGGDVTASAIARGGASGQRGTGGDVDLRDAVSGATTGRLRLVQEARGGDTLLGAGGAARSGLTWLDSDAAALEVVSSAFGGSGLTAGNAHAEASATGQDSVTVEASAVGSAGIVEGGRATLGPVFGESLGGGAVRVVGTAQGGDGEDQFSANVGPGSGASVVVENAVDGRTSGALELVQRAFGGDAGEKHVTNGANPPGLAGSATSRLDRSSAATSFSVEVEAQGGIGGRVSAAGNLTSAGGDALAEGVVENTAGSVQTSLRAGGGRGGRVDNSGSTATGSGGGATVHASARSLGDGRDVEVGGTSSFGAFGGAAGQLLSGPGPRGDGGAAASDSVGIAEGDSRVAVEDVAKGGEGGSGGDATSRAEGQNAGDEDVTVSAQATGGRALDQAGRGGSASAQARGTSPSGNVRVSAVQTSGAGGQTPFGSRSDGIAGADSEMQDAVSGSTAGTLMLSQLAVAGAGEIANTTATGGRGGRAVSSLDATNPAGGALVVLNEARGGDGASSRGSGGASLASARAFGTGGAPVDVTATARGGRGFALTFPPRLSRGRRG